MAMIPYSKVRYIVVHYSATPIEKSFTAADIDRMHKQRGFSKIGYHKFIRRDGTVENGRRMGETDFELGAHVAGSNTLSLGICFEGGVTQAHPNVGRDTRTVMQTQALIAVIDEMKRKCPQAKVVGHYQMPGAATQCPGFDAAAWWTGIEQARLGALRPPPKPRNLMADFLDSLLAIFWNPKK